MTWNSYNNPCYTSMFFFASYFRVCVCVQVFTVFHVFPRFHTVQNHGESMKKCTLKSLEKRSRSADYTTVVIQVCLQNMLCFVVVLPLMRPST